MSGGAENQYNYKQIDPLLHSPIRLAIVSVLAGCEEAEFTYIRDTIQATDGNLSRHLSKLEENGFIEVHKQFIGKKPVTYQKLTDSGRKAFQKYLETLETLEYALNQAVRIPRLLQRIYHERFTMRTGLRYYFP